MLFPAAGVSTHENALCECMICYFLINFSRNSSVTQQISVTLSSVIKGENNNFKYFTYENSCYFIVFDGPCG